MINLLPTEQIATIKSEYRKRRLTVIGILTFLSLLILFLIILSFYIQVRLENKTISEQLSVKQKMLVGTEAGGPDNQLARLAGDIKTISGAEQSRVLPFGFLQKALAAKPAGVKINSLLFAEGVTAGEPTIDLTGVVGSRRLLLTFLEQLRKDKTFTAVDSPVSNLIKESNVDFSLKLHLAKSL